MFFDFGALHLDESDIYLKRETIHQLHAMLYRPFVVYLAVTYTLLIHFHLSD